MYNEQEFGVDHVLCQLSRTMERRYYHRKAGLVKLLLLGFKRGEWTDHHMLRNKKHKTCADLKLETWEAIERHYAMDCCLFDYPSLPTANRGRRYMCWYWVLGKIRNLLTAKERKLIC